MSLKIQPLCLVCLVLLTSSCTGTKDLTFDKLNRNYFGNVDNCESLDPSILTEKDNKTLRVQYPSLWETDFEVDFGIDISSTHYPDSCYRGFNVSVLDFEDYYFKKNPLINYYSFTKFRYKGMRGLYYVRDDLGLRSADSNAYWRAEMKLYDKKSDEIYYIILGKRHTLSGEPNWCDFSPMMKSLVIKR